MAKADQAEKERKKRQSLIARRWKERQERAKAKVNEGIDTAVEKALAEITALGDSARDHWR